MFLRSKQKVIKNNGKSAFSPFCAEILRSFTGLQYLFNDNRNNPPIVVSIVVNIALSMPPLQPFL